MSRPRSTTERRFWRTLYEGATGIDLVLVISIPVVLLAIAALPRSVRTSLAFSYTEPTIPTAFASSFVHLSPAHLAVNLGVYALVVGVTYPLSVLSEQKRRFRVTFVALVLACPIVLSYLNLTIVRQSASVGFSGVLLALYGYLPVALGTYLETEFDLGPDRTTAPLVFFVGTAIITVVTLVAVLANPVVVPVRGIRVPVTMVLAGTLASLAGAIALIVTLYAVSLYERWPAMRANLRKSLDRPGSLELAVVATGVLVAVPIATFPVDPVGGETVSNLYVHVLGYGLGFSGTYTTMVAERWLFKA